MATQREYSCRRCSGGVPERTTLVSERTQFYHNQGRARGGRGRGRQRPRGESDAGSAEEALAAVAQAGGGDSSVEAAGSSAVASEFLSAAAAPPGPDAVAEAVDVVVDNSQASSSAVASFKVGVNGVCIPRAVFCERVDNFVAYSYIHHHRLTREEASDYLLSAPVLSLTAPRGASPSFWGQVLTCTSAALTAVAKSV